MQTVQNSNSDPAATLAQKQTQGKSFKTASQRQELLNRDCLVSLPPGCEGSPQGNLFIDLGAMEWLIYDSVNYLQDPGNGKLPLRNVFANLKFWGDKGRGLFLRPSNAMKGQDKMSNKYAFEIKCPEKSFERYLDDMGALVIDFFDTEKN